MDGASFMLGILFTVVVQCCMIVFLHRVISNATKEQE